MTESKKNIAALARQMEIQRAELNRLTQQMETVQVAVRALQYTLEDVKEARNEVRKPKHRHIGAG